MRTAKLYLHGATMGTPPGKNTHQRSKRGQVGGWSSAATRRNIAFLRSVEPDTIIAPPGGPDLAGFAVTLTLRDCPPSADEWHRLRRTLLKRLERMGLYRCHWVTEWQRRGVPHLHGAFWFPSTDGNQAAAISALVVYHWLTIAQPHGVSARAQHFTPIHDAIGWFQYVAKHAARGVKHYQRSSDSIPPGWKKTGRMWGHTGQWDTRDPIKLTMSDDVFYRLRRLVRSWRVANARASGDSYRLKSARSMLTCHNRPISEVRGISEWVNQENMLTLLDAAHGTGVIES